jgi:hypothetical protein
MQISARSRIIEELRELLLHQADPKASLCLTMSQRGLYCRGFAAWDDEELRARFHWFCLSRPDIERPELETLADRWQLALRTSRSLEVPCDIGGLGPCDRRACMGWPRFTTEELRGFLDELRTHS